MTDLKETADAEREARADVPPVADWYASQCREGNATLDTADATLITQELERHAFALHEEITGFEDAIERTAPEAAAAGRDLAAAESELAECQRRATAIQAATADDDLTTRIEARALRLAINEESAALQARADAARSRVRAFELEEERCRREIRRRQGMIAEFSDAMTSPFTHPLGQAAVGYNLRLLSGRLVPILLLGNKSHPEWNEAYRLLVHLVRVTGLGAETEKRVETGVRDELGNLHFTPEGVPWTYHKPTQSELAHAAKPLPRAPSPAEQRNASPFERVEGVPGVSPDDAGWA
jgi:hypothetical protein